MADRHLYQNSEVIYVAHSPEHAAELLLQDMDGDTSYTDSDPFVLIPDEEPLELGSDESNGAAGEVARDAKNRDGQAVGTYYYETKLAREWVAEWNGVGHLSGGDY
ncbi:MAG TPA: hypothetical protein VFD73_21810 [Gemmatimonadales bacterium]|nr:hypothetical protein [Gemmatimonadales bacterium]